MRVALIALALVAGNAASQTQLPVSQEHKQSVNYLMEQFSMGYAEANLFLHLGQAKESACGINVRSRECQTLAELHDNMKRNLKVAKAR